MRSVSVILPTANQADHIGGIVEAFRDRLASLPIPSEIVLVVNASTDSTREVCDQLAARHPDIRVVDSEPGWGRAVRTGIGAASGDLLCYANSARTQADDLLVMLKFGLVNEQMVVKASRKVRESLTRRLGSVLYNLEIRMLFSLAVWDINGTPKVFAARHLEGLHLTEPGDLIDLEFVVNAKRAGIPIVEVPVYVFKRHGGRSSTNLVSAWRMYWGALRMYLRDRRRIASRLARNRAT